MIGTFSAGHSHHRTSDGIAADQGRDKSHALQKGTPPEYIVPSVFDKRVAEAVAKDVEDAAYQTRVARRDRAVQEEM